MASNQFVFHELLSLNDDLLLPWLDLYETCFPPEQRVLISSNLRAIKGKDSGLTDDEHLIAVLDSEEQLCGIVSYEILRNSSAAVGWYIAVPHKLRNQGIGAIVYREIVKRLKNEGVEAFVFEVEDPNVAEDSNLATRRIRFYRRNGAKLLRGIKYTQTVGPHQPPISMMLMIHPISSDFIGPQRALQLVKCIFKDMVKRTGEVSLD